MKWTGYKIPAMFWPRHSNYATWYTYRTTTITLVNLLDTTPGQKQTTERVKIKVELPVWDDVEVRSVSSIYFFLDATDSSRHDLVIQNMTCIFRIWHGIRSAHVELGSFQQFSLYHKLNPRVGRSLSVAQSIPTLAHKHILLLIANIWRDTVITASTGSFLWHKINLLDMLYA